MLMYAHSIWSEAMKSLRRNLIRTVLTILGLVVGIAAFICVVGVGKAGSAKVEEQLQKLGDNMIWIEAGSRATNGVRFGTRETNSLTVEDAQAIFAEIPGFKRMSPNVDGRVQVVYGTQNWNTTYRGVAPEYFDIRKWEIQAGTIFSHDDVDRDVPVCIFGSNCGSESVSKRRPGRQEHPRASNAVSRDRNLQAEGSVCQRLGPGRFRCHALHHRNEANQRHELAG